jgi:chemotaxis protein MotB
MSAAKGGKTSSAKRRKKAVHGGGEEGGAERWLVTYADMLTLLLVLFIVLFSISVVNVSKFITLRTSLSTAFGNGQKSVLDGGTALNDNASEGQGIQFVVPGAPLSPTLGKGAATKALAAVKAKEAALATKVAKQAESFEKIKKMINEALARNGLTGTVQFNIDHRGLIITVLTNALVFPGNSATLLSGGQRILGVIAPQLKNTTNSIEVDGFTNQEKVSTAPYPSGWELSSARASAVVRFLIHGGVHESRLSAVGYSDQRPLFPASDPRSVTRNRRVEIVVLSSLPAGTEDALQAAGSK